MLLINRLTEPGGVKRLELHTDTVRVVLRDGTERVYTNSRSGGVNQELISVPNNETNGRED